MKYIYSILSALTLALLLTATGVQAQSNPQADPAVLDINKQGPGDPNPTGINISGTAILKFEVENASTGTTANGLIPAGAVEYTLTFNKYFTYESLVASSDFFVFSSSPGAPNYTVKIRNSVALVPTGPSTPAYVFYINVKGTEQTTAPGQAIVTMNVVRTLPIQCANIDAGNDNVSKGFNVIALASLPLHSIDLVATLNNQNIDLKWTTRDELNVDNFELQRSTDGSNFDPIATKQAVGNTVGVTNYAYPDNINTLSAAVIFYRVKVTDKDGFTYYSKIVAVPLKKKATITAWPNPFVDKINFAISATAKGQATVRLYNTSGQIMKQVEVSVSAGNNFIAVDNLDRLPKQTYLVEVTMNNEKIFSGKLIK